MLIAKRSWIHIRSGAVAGESGSGAGHRSDRIAHHDAATSHRRQPERHNVVMIFPASDIPPELRHGCGYTLANVSGDRRSG